MATQGIAELRARLDGLPNHADGTDIVKALVDIAEVLVLLDSKLAVALDSIDKLASLQK
jgi:hypothetical protein